MSTSFCDLAMRHGVDNGRGPEDFADARRYDDMVPLHVQVEATPEALNP